MCLDAEINLQPPIPLLSQHCFWHSSRSWDNDCQGAFSDHNPIPGGSKCGCQSECRNQCWKQVPRHFLILIHEWQLSSCSNRGRPSHSAGTHSLSPPFPPSELGHSASLSARQLQTQKLTLIAFFSLVCQWGHLGLNCLTPQLSLDQGDKV